MRLWLTGSCLLVLLGCEDAPQKASTPTPEAAPARVEILTAPDGEPATQIIQREGERAARDGRQLVVYVGAAWCEPCVRFHDAAAKGELDTTFPRLRLLEFDRDRDEGRLADAGCLSRLIPLFARPNAQGRCSDQRMEGSIKGEGAVAEITPRLRRLLQ